MSDLVANNYIKEWFTKNKGWVTVSIQKYEECCLACGGKQEIKVTETVGDCVIGYEYHVFCKVCSRHFELR